MSKLKAKQNAQNDDPIKEALDSIVAKYESKINDTKAVLESRKLAFDLAAQEIDQTLRVLGDSAIACLRQKLLD